MKRILILFFLLSVVTINAQHYQSNWESLQTHKTPEWFRDAKFGIYFHWGVYSAPAFGGEWYPRWMYYPGTHWGKNYFEHHRQTWGDQSEFGYKDFIPLFTAEHFNADEWAELFAKAGAQFAGPVAEHADGFSMWDSNVNKWNAAQMGPKRDVVGELEQAIRKQGLKFMTSFHHQWLWGWYPTWRAEYDCGNPEFADFYGPALPETSAHYRKPVPLPDSAFQRTWYDKIIEVIDAYQPDLIWFDSRAAIIDSTVRMDMLSYYYNRAQEWGRDVTITYKNEDFVQGSGVVDLERGRMSSLTNYPWLNDDSIDWNSWCHVSEPNYKPVNRLIDGLVDIVSKNGALLLNITPTAQGEIPQGVRDRLLQMGEWLALNGEAIYGSRPWTIFGGGPTKVAEGHFTENKIGEFTAQDIRFTTKGDTLYAIALDWPGSQLVITSLGRRAGLFHGDISSVRLLGHAEPLPFTQKEDALVISLPDSKPCEHAFVFVIN